MLRFERAAIVGATGSTGIHLAKALRGVVAAVRVVSRNEQNLVRQFPGEDVERVRGDATVAENILHAIDDCDLVFDCIGLPAVSMPLHPKTAENIARAASKTGARLVHISSYWAYLPIVRLPVDENHPRTGGPRWSVLRRQAEDILQAAGAAVLNLPDFYGPNVHTSTLQNALADAVAGRKMNWIGGADTEHEFVFVPDAVKIAAAIVGHEQAYGDRWIVPGAGPITARQLAEMVRQKLGANVKLRAAAPWLLRIVGLVNSDLRAFAQMVPHYARAIVYDASKLRRLLGQVEVTPYADGISSTLDWMKSR